MEKYVKVRKIGQGSFGCAYLATRKDSDASDQLPKQQFVIKEVVLDPRDQANAQREARLLAALDHPNIIACKESFILKPSVSNAALVARSPAVLCIVTEFADGGDFSHELERRSSRRVFFDPDELLGLFVQVCLALKHLHDRKILHRDIKPANIFLTKSGVVKLGDLGVATVLSHTLACAQTAIGTPYYTAPEICLGQRYNAKADVWSLGCVLYELVCFLHAFEGRSQRQLFDNIIRGPTPQIPGCGSLTSIRRELQSLVDDMLRKEPRLRPSVNQLIRRPIVLGRIQRLLSAHAISSELSHTVLHGQHVFAKKSKPEVVDPPSKPLEQVVRRAEPVSRSPSIVGVGNPSFRQLPKASKKTPPAYGKARVAALLNSSKKAKPRGLPNGALRRPLQKGLQPTPKTRAIGSTAASVSKNVRKRVVPAGAKQLSAAKAKGRDQVKKDEPAALLEPPASAIAPTENKTPKRISERAVAFNEKWAAQREKLAKNLMPPPPPVAAKVVATKNEPPMKVKQPPRGYPKPVEIAVEGQPLSTVKTLRPPPPVRHPAKQKTPKSVPKPGASRAAEPSLRERRLEFQRQKQAEPGGPNKKASPLDNPIILVQQLSKAPAPTGDHLEVLPPPAPTPAHFTPDEATKIESDTIDSKQSDEDDNHDQTLLPPMANLEFERMLLQLKSVVDAASSDSDSEDEDELGGVDPNAPPPPYSPARVSPTVSLQTLSVKVLEDPMFRLALQKRLQDNALDKGENDNEVAKAKWDSELSLVDPTQHEMLTWMHTYISSLL